MVDCPSFSIFLFVSFSVFVCFFAMKILSKVITYGSTSSNADYTSQIGVECIDSMMISEQSTIRVGRHGGLGLGLEEMYSLRGNAGLVLIDSIAPGSNAEKTGRFLIGDTMISVSDSANPAATTKSLQGKPNKVYYILSNI